MAIVPRFVVNLLAVVICVTSKFLVSIDGGCRTYMPLFGLCTGKRAPGPGQAEAPPGEVQMLARFQENRGGELLCSSCP